MSSGQAALPNPPATTAGRCLDLALGALLALLLMTVGVVVSIGYAGLHLLLAMLVYALVAALVLMWMPRSSPGPGLGPGNRVTLVRVVLLAVITPAVVVDGEASQLHGWMALVAFCALLLDGVDGRVARATGTVTDFGARFDEEIDAAVILVLSTLIWRSTDLGFWVLAIGGMRYAFLLAAWGLPAMRAPLPPRWRRKAICVLQVAALLICLLPWMPDALRLWLLAAALLALVYSFAVDVLWLFGQGRRWRL